MKKIAVITNSEKETKKIAENLGKKLLQVKGNKSVILALSGDLGSGKTTFIQGLAKGLNIKNKIISPTFIINKRYKIKGVFYKNFYHIDAYRIKTKKDLETTGVFGAIKNKTSILAIEWANIIKKHLPKNVINIKLKHISPKSRKIIFEKK